MHAATAAWLGFLFCSTAESMRKRVATKESVRRLRGSVFPKIGFRTSLGPRSHLVRTWFKLQPVKTASVHMVFNTSGYIYF